MGLKMVNWTCHRFGTTNLATISTSVNYAKKTAEMRLKVVREIVNPKDNVEIIV